MGENESLGERIVRLETQIGQVLEASRARATREWAIVMTGIGLIGTILAKNLGWLP